MATPIGTNVVTSIARRYILDEVTDNVYRANVVFFRLWSNNKRQVRGGYQIEAPLMYSRLAAGGFYQGFDQLDITPSDTVKNGAWDWKQAYVPVTVDGLTLIKTDSPESVVDFIKMYFAQAEMELAEILGAGLWTFPSPGGKGPDAIPFAIDDGSQTQNTYAGLDRSVNTWWRAGIDNSAAALANLKMRQAFGAATEGGRHPTLIVTRQDNYNRYWTLQATNQTFPAEPRAMDEQLAQAGFHNLLFDGCPIVVDPHVPDGTTAGFSQMYFLNENYMYFVVSPRADFYLEDFQTPTNQDAMTAKLLWAGNLVFTNLLRQFKITNING